MTEQPVRPAPRSDLRNTAAILPPRPEQPTYPTTAAGQPVRLLTLTDVIDRVNLQKSWLYAAIARGDFPAPLKTINARRALFSSHDVEAWIAEKTAPAASVAASEKGCGK